MIDQTEAQLLRDPALQLLEFRIDELENPSVLTVNQMIVTRVWRWLVARAAVAELVPLKTVTARMVAAGFDLSGLCVPVAAEARQESR